MVKITYKGETRDIPKRYIPDTLSKAERQKQIKSIFEGKKRPETKVKERKSSWTTKFDKKYGEELDAMKGKRSKKNVAKVTGIPFKAIDEVYKKGEGAFYSSLDADSVSEDGELEEGAYYVFNKKELALQLKEDFTIFSDYYNITNYGKWEKENYVLIRKKSDQEIIAEFSISQEELNQKKKNWKQQLLAYRNNRPKPRLDDKTLTSWNALMIKGYVEAYKAFQVTEYLNAAQTNAQFLIDNQLQENGALNHSYKDGKSTINGYLEDYAAVIDAFIALYEVTLNELWINKANELAAYTFENFFDAEKNMFYFTSKEDEKLVARNFEYRDNVIPASNSIMAKNLLILSHHFDNEKYLTTSSKMLHNVQPEIESYPSGFSNWLDLMSNFQDNFYEVVVVGKDASKKIAELNARYLPNILIAGSTSESKKPLLNYRYIDGETLIYVCVNNSCKLPVSDISEALNFIK